MTPQEELVIRRQIAAAQRNEDPHMELQYRRQLSGGVPPAATETTPDLTQQLAEEQGPLDAAVIAAGRGFTQLGRGIADLFRNPNQPRQLDPMEEQAYAALQKERPITTALGESAPYMAAGGIAGAIPRVAAAGLGANLGAQAAAGATVGAAMPGTLEERAKRAAVEGALGATGEALGRGIVKAFAPGMKRGAMTPTEVVRAEQLGYQVLPSSKMANPRLRQLVEGGFETNPASAGLLDEISFKNQAVLNRDAAKSIGLEDVDELTPENLGAAYEGISKKFENSLKVSRTGPIEISSDAQDVLDDIIDRQVAPYALGAENPIRAAVDKLRESIRGRGDVLTPKEMQQKISEFGVHANQQMTSNMGNREVGRALYGIQNVLMDELTSALPKESAEMYKQARRQYRNLMILESPGVIDSGSGDVSGARLAGVLERKDKAGFKRGGQLGDTPIDMLKNIEQPGSAPESNPLYTGARFLGRQQRPLQTSGTAERSWMNTALSQFGSPMAFAGLGAAGSMGGEGDPLTGALAGGVLGLAAPRLAAKMYLRPGTSRYLMRQLGDTPAANTARQVARGTGLGFVNTLFDPEDRSKALAELERNRERELKARRRQDIEEDILYRQSLAR